MKSRLPGAGLFLLALSAFAADRTPVQQAPAEAAAFSSPFAGSERARKAGAKLYERECATCHGANGEGSGKALPLHSLEVDASAPGRLFWVLTNGSLRRGMPSFASLPARERWQIVEYLKQAR
jgi:mono/diheme cytochrome c family protein